MHRKQTCDERLRVKNPAILRLDVALQYHRIGCQPFACASCAREPPTQYLRQAQCPHNVRRRERSGELQRVGTLAVRAGRAGVTCMLTTWACWNLGLQTPHGCKSNARMARMLPQKYREGTMKVVESEELPIVHRRDEELAAAQASRRSMQPDLPAITRRPSRPPRSHPWRLAGASGGNCACQGAAWRSLRRSRSWGCAFAARCIRRRSVLCVQVHVRCI